MIIAIRGKTNGKPLTKQYGLNELRPTVENVSNVPDACTVTVSPPYKMAVNAKEILESYVLLEAHYRDKTTDTNYVEQCALIVSYYPTLVATLDSFATHLHTFISLNVGSDAQKYIADEAQFKTAVHKALREYLVADVEELEQLFQRASTQVSFTEETVHLALDANRNVKMSLSTGSLYKCHGIYGINGYVVNEHSYDLLNAVMKVVHNTAMERVNEANIISKKTMQLQMNTTFAVLDHIDVTYTPRKGTEQRAKLAIDESHQRSLVVKVEDKIIDLAECDACSTFTYEHITDKHYLIRVPTIRIDTPSDPTIVDIGTLTFDIYLNPNLHYDIDAVRNALLQVLTNTTIIRQIMFSAGSFFDGSFIPSMRKLLYTIS